ncbi:hypothetical protein SAY86_025667 [Trapa natans]|uniref:Protein BIG GRAIN 1-like B n=1 Tax=Trapa natans TaxID=22666 RepID=A0AAN7KEF6_TRANT|nr:hypothetical protein SAY86_025667 [Trapa natans]
MSWDRRRKLFDAYYGDCNGSRRPDRYLSSPSFSSTLLDSIYRSIDEGSGGGHHHQQRHQTQEPKRVTDEYQRRPCRSEEAAVQRRSPVNARLRRSFIGFLLKNSSSSSSDSSSNKERLSSSDSDSSSPARSRSRYSSSCYSMKKLKTIRTSNITTDGSEQVLRSTNNGHKEEGSTVSKAKSKAMKVYGEFMKVSGYNGSKLPVSPGIKLSSFLNSLFNSKKTKLSSRYDDSFPGKAAANPGYYSTTCSPACSFSRSCLSKTPSSRGKFADDGTRRSVRFGPVSVVVDHDQDQDLRPCMQKTTVPLRDQPQELGSRKTASVKGCPGEESAAKNYLKKGKDQELLDVEGQDQDQEEEEEDGVSCASSDLFELENLSGIDGRSRHIEELPVYETTNLDTNRAITIEQGKKGL